jgi:hypothetical protein
MADNLSVNVTADATQLRAQLALAQADLRSYSAAVRSAANDIRSTGSATAEQTVALEKAAQGYNAARTAVSGLRTALGDGVATARSAAQGLEATGEAAGHGETHIAGMTRELVRLGREGMEGEFSRIPGSMIVLATRSGELMSALGSLNPAFYAAAAAGAVLTGGLVIMAMRAHETAVALREAANEAVLQGRSGATARADTLAYADALQKTGIMGHAAAVQTASAIEQLTNVTEDQKARINAIAPGFFVALDQDAQKTVKSIGEIFGSDTSLKAYLDKYHVLSTEQMTAWAGATNAADRYKIGIDALTARLDAPIARFKQLNNEASQNAALSAAYAIGGSGALPPVQGALLPPTDLGEPGTQAPNPQQAQDTETAIKYSAELRKQNELTEALASAQRALTAAQTAGDNAGIATAGAAIKQIQVDMAGLKEPGDADWASKIAEQAKEAGDKAVIAAHDAGQQRVAIMEAGTRAELAVYQAAAQDMTRTDAERLAAKRQALDLEMSLVKEQSAGEATAAKQAFAAKVAEFDQEIAAARGNASQIMALEQQKLDYIRQARGATSAEYQNALKQETEAVRTAVDQQIKAIEDGGKRQLADQAAVLKDELATQQITKAQETQELLQQAETERDTELQSLATLIAGLQEGTAAYKAAMDARTKLIQDFATRIKTLQAQTDASTTQSAEKMAQSYISAFSSIGSAAERAFTGLVLRTTTWQRAEQQVASSVLNSFVSMTATMLERWVVLQAAKLTSDQAAIAVGQAQELSANTTGMSVLLARWIALEEGKSAITADNAAARAATDSGGSFIGAIGQILARWLGLETAKDAATTSGAATRATTESTAAAASLAAIGVAARAQVTAAAAVSAAWAFADTASLGPEGLAAAPAAAAAAEGTVMAFQGLIPLATGAYNIPRDMAAVVHQGEMVVPRPYADEIRSSNNPAIGGNSSVNATYAPNLSGSGLDTRRLARQQFQQFKDYASNVGRNGALKFPGR